MAPAAVNRLIEALPYKDRRRLLAACEPVELTFADVRIPPLPQPLPREGGGELDRARGGVDG
jgi:hypothetical protein